MTIVEVINYFENLNKACLALNITPQNMTLWKNQGYIPLISQYRFFVLTKGALLPDKDDPNPTKRKRHMKRQEKLKVVQNV